MKTYCITTRSQTPGTDAARSMKSHSRATMIIIGIPVMLLLAGVGMSQAASVSWDGSSSDITGLSANVNSTPNTWTAGDAIWSTSDEIVAEVGSQASFKVAISQAETAQRRIAQVNAGNDTAFVGGGSLNPEGQAGHSPSPWANLIGFDTTSFDDALVLSEISVTLRNRNAPDTLDVRWFVEAGGNTYVSEVVGAGISTTNATLTLADATAIEWFAFDANANIEIGAALGASVGTLSLTNVDYVGIHQQMTYTTLQNWHGAFVSRFAATAVPIEPPRLFIGYNPVFEEVMVSWMTNNGPFRLESKLDLVDTNAAWTTVAPGSILPHGGNMLQHITLPDSPLKVFRLVKEQ